MGELSTMPKAITELNCCSLRATHTFTTLSQPLMVGPYLQGTVPSTEGAEHRTS